MGHGQAQLALHWATTRLCGSNCAFPPFRRDVGTARGDRMRVNETPFVVGVVSRGSTEGDGGFAQYCRIRVLLPISKRMEWFFLFNRKRDARAVHVASFSRSKGLSDGVASCIRIGQEHIYSCSFRCHGMEVLAISASILALAHKRGMTTCVPDRFVV